LFDGFAYENAARMKMHWTLAIVFAATALAWLMLTWGDSEEVGWSDPEEVGPEPERAPQAPREGEDQVAQPPSPSEAKPAPSDPSAQTALHADEELAPNAPPRIPVPARSGPVEELKRAFETEPRVSSSFNSEKKIAAHFDRSEVRPGLVKSIQCRTSVCRLETRWSPENAEGFMSGLMHLVTDAHEHDRFDAELGIAPQGEQTRDGSQEIEVFVKRVAGPASQPDHERRDQR
jgi:hypothetical protein